MRLIAQAYEGLAIEVDATHLDIRFKGLLERLALCHSAPRWIIVDNRRELTGKMLDTGAHQSGIMLEFIGLGRPTRGGYLEIVNGTFRARLGRYMKQKLTCHRWGNDLERLVQAAEALHSYLSRMA